MIFQTVIDQVHLLHEKEEWHQEITDEHGAITELPDMFGAIVSESVQLIKEALISVDQREEDIGKDGGDDGDFTHGTLRVLRQETVRVGNNADDAPQALYGSARRARRSGQCCAKKAPMRSKPRLMASSLAA